MSTQSAPANTAHVLNREIEAVNILIANFGDVLGEDAELKQIAVDGETNLNEAIAFGVQRIAEIDALTKGIGEMMNNLDVRAHRLKEQKENLRALLVEAMETGGVKKCETPAGTISLQNVAPKLSIVDEADIPARFWRPQDPKLDNKGLTAALKAGEHVPGAQLDNGSITVAIRMK